MQAELAAMGLGTVLPEVHRLPDPEPEASALEGEAEAGGGEGGADMGRHVVGSLVIVSIGAQAALAADRPDALGGDQGPQVGGEILQNPRIGIFVHSQAAAGMQAGEGG